MKFVEFLVGLVKEVIWLLVDNKYFDCLFIEDMVVVIGNRVLIIYFVCNFFWIIVNVLMYVSVYS